MENCLQDWFSGVTCNDVSVTEIWCSDTESFATKLAVLARYCEDDNLRANLLGARLKEDALDIFEIIRLHLLQVGLESSSAYRSTTHTGRKYETCSISSGIRN